ncbi:hypothetical protein [Rhizobium rhizogenes]|uniref:hypothetical protein n=1 Tax=Rhizobium rhizogenes TaxID=359 RepID=UPI00157450CD|nr:hypothetical protein [Rhizobium rhizogenes]NTF80868.1 hypothetical protein [Rhizobium rhizogenes]
MRYLSFLIFILFASSAYSQVDVANQCLEIYKGSLRRLQSSNQANIAIETVARDTCSGSSFNLEAGFDSKTQAIVSGVPGVNTLLGNLGISSTKQLCEAYRNGRFSLSIDDRMLSEPVVEAMEQANKCMEIANRRDVVLRHDVLDPGNISFAALFQRSDRTLRFTVQTTGGFTCVSARPGTSKLDKVDQHETVRKIDFTISCSRKGMALEGGNIDYPDGVVSLNIGEAIYTVRVPADTKYGLTSRRAADSVIANMKTSLAKADSDLVALQQSYARRTYTPEVFYFGEHDQGAPFSVPVRMRFGCEHFQYKTQDQWQPVVKERLCPDGSIKNISRIYERGGNRCGYTYFTMVCERGG